MKLLMFDGYIRNRAQLCEELSVEPSASQDAERAILEAGFAKWGCDLGNHICGSFALAILNEASGELFCARDPLGTRPFYYSLDASGALRYGSDIAEVAARQHPRGVVIPGQDPRGVVGGIDRDALLRYLMFGYPAGESTLYAGVKKLMPGHYLVFDGKTCMTRPYFSLSFEPDHLRTEKQWVHDIERVLKGVLDEDAERLAPDGLRTFLSSGVDSSYLLALSGAKRAYGIGYDEEGCSEAKEAAKTARALGAEFVETRVTSDMFFDAVSRLVRSAGLPLADPSSAALLVGCEQVAHDGASCLSGEGSDELFAGYHLYRRADEIGWTGGPWHFGSTGIMEASAAQRLLKLDQPPSAEPVENIVRDIYETSESWEHLSRLQAIDCALWFEGGILLGANAAARASGIELLMPYADRRVIDLATRIPARLRLKDGCGKYLLRKAAEKRLPHEVAFRRKVGFSVPIRSWMREGRHRAAIEAELFGSHSALFFDSGLVRRYWTSYLEGNDDIWQVVYALYVFLVWYRHCYLKQEANEG